LRDGYAVDAAALADAGPYMPVALPATARRIDAGAALPSDYDAVLPVDAVALRGGRIEAVASVAPGEGVLPAGDDASPRTPLRCAGERLRALDIAVMGAAGIEAVMVRAPRVGVVCSNPTRSRIVEAAREMLVRAVVGAGAAPFGTAQILLAALDDKQSDLMISIGGTGSGREDDAVRTLARYGAVEAHGIAVSPGETAALGFIGTRPVLLVPGRLDAVLAIWLLIGRHLVARLAGGKVEDMPVTMPLKRKVTSSIGLTEVMPVRCADGMAEPLSSGYLSFTALARSDGWIVVPAESEGFAAGTPVAVRPWP
ncbi:MAG TPA: molybdopterin-binding protein, partial [Xanthobacteraceae bacterium]|nr:molybdopterin-binding protein [Xanthobacteraceae bacterium]